MDMSNSIKSQLDMARNVHDMSSLNQLKSAAKANDEGALREAAEQFEAIFVNMLLKSMRKAQEAIADKDSPFNSQQVKFYRDMHDQQLAVDLAGGGSLGLADIIVRQLGNEQLLNRAGSEMTSGDLASYNRQQRQAVVAAEDRVLPTETKRAGFASPQDFVEQLYPLAQEHAKSLGIDPEALIAQAAVETGWGQHMIHTASGSNTHNLFGIKADNRWKGDKATVQTLEYQGDIARQQKAHFRAYPSLDQAMQDYVNFVSDNPRYQSALENTRNPKVYFEQLQKAGYATDPKYADKVMSVLGSQTLQSFKNDEAMP